MKLKIKITGPKVHDVGYRTCLIELAMLLALRGFEVYYDDDEGQQTVIALVEGDEQRITKFYNSVMKERPQHASVDNVRSEDYSGDVMPSHEKLLRHTGFSCLGHDPCLRIMSSLWQFASINTASQMNKLFRTSWQ